VFQTNNGSGNLTNSVLGFDDTSGNHSDYGANHIVFQNNNGSGNLTNSVLTFDDTSGNHSDYRANYIQFQNNNNGSANLTNSVLTFQDTSGNTAYYSKDSISINDNFGNNININPVIYQLNNTTSQINVTPLVVRFKDVSTNDIKASYEKTKMYINDYSGNKIQIQPTNITFSGICSDVINSNTISNLKNAIIQLYILTGNTPPNYL
jgi:hypothetical protein